MLRGPIRWVGHMEDQLIPNQVDLANHGDGDGNRRIDENLGVLAGRLHTQGVLGTELSDKFLRQVEVLLAPDDQVFSLPVSNEEGQIGIRTQSAVPPPPAASQEGEQAQEEASAGNGAAVCHGDGHRRSGRA